MDPHLPPPLRRRTLLSPRPPDVGVAGANGCVVDGVISEGSRAAASADEVAMLVVDDLQENLAQAVGVNSQSGRPWLRQWGVAHQTAPNSGTAAMNAQTVTANPAGETTVSIDCMEELATRPPNPPIRNVESSFLRSKSATRMRTHSRTLRPLAPGRARRCHALHARAPHTPGRHVARQAPVHASLTVGRLRRWAVEPSAGRCRPPARWGRGRGLRDVSVRASSLGL